MSDVSALRAPARVPLKFEPGFSWRAVALVMAEKFGLRGLRIALMIGTMIGYFWWRGCDGIVCIVLYVFAAATLVLLILMVWTAKESHSTNLRVNTPTALGLSSMTKGWAARRFLQTAKSVSGYRGINFGASRNGRAFGCSKPPAADGWCCQRPISRPRLGRNFERIGAILWLLAHPSGRSCAASTINGRPNQVRMLNVLMA
jgi:hypothetical protein